MSLGMDDGDWHAWQSSTLSNLESMKGAWRMWVKVVAFSSGRQDYILTGGSIDNTRRIKVGQSRARFCHPNSFKRGFLPPLEVASNKLRSTLPPRPRS